MKDLHPDSPYKQMLDAIPDLVLVKGPKSHIWWANKAFLNYYGMTNEQLRDLVDSPIVEPDMTQSYIRDDAQVFTTGQVLDIPCEPITRHDGVVRQFHTVKSPIRGLDGQIIMTIGISRDIEDRLQTEALKNKLAQAEKLSAVGQLAAGMAHEINNPLGVILGFAETLKRRLQPTDPFYEPIISILRESLRCKSLIQNLMTFARHKMPGMHMENPQNILEHVLTLIEKQVLDKKVSVIHKFASETHLVHLDHDQIHQVVMTLCSNALDAMPKGGTLTITTHYKPEAWVLTIADTGEGIPTGHASRIFEPFFTTKEVGYGRGLGLSLSYQIVQQHKGHLTFQSQPGQGTTFTVEIPRN